MDAFIHIEMEWVETQTLLIGTNGLFVTP